MSIEDIGQKIKRVVNIAIQRDIFTVIIIISVSFASFGLGRLSVRGLDTPVIIENESFVIESVSGSTEVKASGLLVASKNSTKYHFPWCSGAQRISEKNKIWFDSKEEAEKAGYTPASNCKGL